MRRNNKYTDFIGKKIQYDTDKENVVDGLFECNHCGKANIRYRDLNEHFEECFKKEEEEWQSEHRPSFDIEGWDLCYVRFQGPCMDVCVLPKLKHKEYDNTIDIPKTKLKLINSNVGLGRVEEAIGSFCSKHSISPEVIKIKRNKQGNYALFYEVPDEEE